MGIGDFLRRRRERESALAPEAIEELGAEAGSSAASAPRAADQNAATDPAEADSEREPSGATELPGANAAELGAMLRRAAMSGLPQVSTESHTLDPNGEGNLGNEIAGILGGHGLGGGGAHEVDLDELRDLHEQVRDALRREGIDPDSDRWT